VVLAAQTSGSPSLVYVAALLAGLLAGMAANLCADLVVGDEEPPWRAADCRTCRTPLPRERLIPLLNLSGTRRRCPACGSHASWRRPLVELALAVVFPLLLAHAVSPSGAGRLAPWAIFLIDAAGCAILAFIFAVDLEHHLILDVAIYPAVVALVGLALLFNHKALAGMLFGVVICGGLFFLLYALGYLLYRSEALGFGDVKLAVLIGLLVGWPGVMTALVVAALLGAAVSVLLLGLGTASGKAYIPYGTVLAAGAVAALLTAAPVW
jgi:leader peptidase (prepilin peptidase)/N-methyltransferase